MSFTYLWIAGFGLCNICGSWCDLTHHARWTLFQEDIVVIIIIIFIVIATLKRAVLFPIVA